MTETRLTENELKLIRYLRRLPDIPKEQYDAHKRRALALAAGEPEVTAFITTVFTCTDAVRADGGGPMTEREARQ